MDPAARDHSTPNLDLSILPPVFLLPTHLSLTELHEIEEQLSSGGAPLTYDITEAKVVLGAISTERRATFELKSRKVWTEAVSKEVAENPVGSTEVDNDETPPRKRRRLAGEVASGSFPAAIAVHDSSTDSGTDDETETETETEAATSPAGPMSQLSISQASTTATALSSDPIEPADETPPPFPPDSFSELIKVVKVEWLNASLAAERILPLDPYIIYEGRVVPRPQDAVTPQKPVDKTIFVKANPSAEGRTPLVQQSTFQGDFQGTKSAFRAGPAKHGKRNQVDEAMHKEFQGRSFASSSTQASQRASQKDGHFKTRPTHLLHQTTSEHDEGISSSIPEMPDWVKDGKIYACERSAPFNSPNEDFIELLKKIRLARTLTADEIGVRAYSTSIASIAAYPYKLTSTQEILLLPGCDQKIATLFHEFHTTGRIRAVDDLEADPTLSVLRLFYEIWGVGATTARQFYYENGYRDLDDIVERGWSSLSRVQQIGLKYYDDFQLKIPRSEVEAIAAIILTHARKVRDPGVECIIVGGYRRGKQESGDVDLILTHRDQTATLNLVTDVVTSLESEGWITHTLTLALTNSHRNQQPLPLRVTEKSPRGAGFDTLDKALVVWQDIHSPPASPSTPNRIKNPNPHRRVDIIISPFRTIGCAVSGWTSGTTFQRDLRRYAKRYKGWKFDSSGVRERNTGRWVDLERGSATWEEAERRVFEGMGLQWREPGERCTG